MAASAEQIKELLGNGLSNEVVATAVGVHPSYVSQLMAEEAFANEVIALRTKTLAASSKRDRSWDGIEDKLLSKLSEQVDLNMIYKPTDVLRALHVVNNAKRRGNSVESGLVVNNVVVNLRLPKVIKNAYTRNIDGEVVEVTTPEGEVQTLVTMPASTLMQKLSETHQGKQYDKVRRYLPGHSEEKNVER